jgi:radical SAM protein with 4Fe4S-binding SPASM domain
MKGRGGGERGGMGEGGKRGGMGERGEGVEGRGEEESVERRALSIIVYIACPMKYINAILSGTSFLVSSLAKRPVMFGMPPAVGIELTNHCNLRCPECPSGAGIMNRERGFMDPDLFRQISGEMKRYLLNMNLYFQGEPMMHPRFFEILIMAQDINSTVSTNGHFLTREDSGRLVLSGLGRLVVSLDGMDKETYSSYRINGNFERVTAGISYVSEAIRKYNSPMKLVVQMLVNRYNEDQISLLREFASRNRASLSLKSMQINSKGKVGYWLPSESRYRRYSAEGESFAIRSTLPRRCARMWFNPVVTWDGLVVPCCFDKDASHVMGDLKKESFKKIWYGQNYTEFREQVMKGREKIEICRNCTSGLKGVVS